MSSVWHPFLWAWIAAAMALSGGTALAAPAGEPQRCVPREARNTFQGAVVHAPVAEGRCAACHGPHESERGRLLRDDIPELCIGCHDQPMEDTSGRTLPSVKALFEAAALPPGEGGLRLHKPFADGDCTCCHDPHASSSPRLLSGPYPWSTYIRYAPERYMCFHCHDERAFAEPRTLDATRFRNGNLNLHHRHVNRDKGRSCTVCHEYHASTYEALIRREAPFGTESIPIKEFARTETGGSCAPTCHRPLEYDRLLPALIPMAVSAREGEDATEEELRHAAQPPEAK
jgi:predicted CXXCH cytochrome family protein